MRLACMFLFVFNSLYLTAQENATYYGIRWENPLSWVQIQAKAKAENKFIFVDCYATWCGPCKLMDREVYPLENVGDYIKSNFIAVKVQMDTSENDDSQDKNWYKDAKVIKETYKVTSFPTYLFFTPTGEIVHRFSGALRDTDFIKVAQNALVPEKQFYTLLKNYQKGEKEYLKMQYLADMAKAIGENELAINVAADYIDNYLNRQPETELYSTNVISFLTTSPFLQLWGTKDKVFNFFFKNVDSINKIKGLNDFSQQVVRFIITKDEVNPKLWPSNKIANGKPNWKKLSEILSKKYNYEYASQIILNAQLQWYDEKKDWAMLAKYHIEKITRYGLDTAGFGKNFTNNMIWDVIFLHISDTVVLRKSIEWMKIIIDSDPDNPVWIDTYANLLYKYGKADDAIMWEQKAIKLDELKLKKGIPVPNYIYHLSTLARMKDGTPTWLSDSAKH